MIQKFIASLSTATIALTSILVLTGTAKAATLAYTSLVELDKNLDWLVNQFDPNQGTLNSVTITLEGIVEGSASAESIDISAATEISFSLGSNLALTTAGGEQLVQIAPSVSRTFNATIFDGALDFEGSSGFSSGTLVAQDTQTQTFSSDPLLSEFIGSGELGLKLLNTPTSSIPSTSGLLQSQPFEIKTAANITVIYSYDSKPTEPTEPTDPTDPTEPTDPTDPTEPTDPTDPTEPTEPTEPTDPTDPTDPTEPTDPTTVPEPSTILGIGLLAGLGLFKSRGKKL